MLAVCIVTHFCLLTTGLILCQWFHAELLCTSTFLCTFSESYPFLDVLLLFFGIIFFFFSLSSSPFFTFCLECKIGDCVMNMVSVWPAIGFYRILLFQRHYLWNFAWWQAPRNFTHVYQLDLIPVLWWLEKMKLRLELCLLTHHHPVTLWLCMAVVCTDTAVSITLQVTLA